MKNTTKIFALFMLLSIASSVFAFSQKIDKTHPKYEQIEANLLEGLKIGNFGLKLDVIYRLGEVRSARAVNPLIKVLRTDKDERLRIVAALALMKINTERSIYMVKRVAIFGNNDKVRKMCKKFYNAHVIQQINKFGESDNYRYASLIE